VDPADFLLQSAAGYVVRQWSFNTLQVSDFVITPDGSRIIAITTSLKRVPIENKLKPSMSARVVDPPGAVTVSGPGPGAVGDELGGFGYGSMEHAMMIVRLSDKEITE